MSIPKKPWASMFPLELACLSRCIKVGDLSLFVTPASNHGSILSVGCAKKFAELEGNTVKVDVETSPKHLAVQHRIPSKRHNESMFCPL